MTKNTVWPCCIVHPLAAPPSDQAMPSSRSLSGTELTHKFTETVIVLCVSSNQKKKIPAQRQENGLKVPPLTKSYLQLKPAGRGKICFLL